jgi:hypothetical protein
MRAYVQDVKGDRPSYLGMVECTHWFERRGYEVIRFEYEEIAQGRLDFDLRNHPEETVVRGGVRAVLDALVRAGRPLPPLFDLPPSLTPWIGRRFWQSTMGEIRSAVASDNFTPVHIKPLNQHKLFKGAVVREFRDLIPTAGVSSDILVLAQECVEFVSEWRATILRDRILHIGHYRGDPLTFPDPVVVRSSVSEFEGRPIGFGMDWGITSSGKTLLVEVNDGFALGNYGIPGTHYTALIEARWRQLMGLSDNGVGEMPYV